MSTLDRMFAARWPVVQVVVAVQRPAGRTDEMRAFRVPAPQNRETEINLSLR